MFNTINKKITITVLCFILLLLAFFLKNKKYEFCIEDRLIVELDMENSYNNLVDNSVRYSMVIEDLEKKQSSNYNFFFQDGPCFYFCTSKKYPNLIWLRDYFDNGNDGWLIDLNTHKISQVYKGAEKFKEKKFKVIGRIDGNSKWRWSYGEKDDVLFPNNDLFLF